MICINFEKWVNEFSNRGDGITQIYFDKDWWKVQILESVDKNNIGQIRKMYDEDDIFCREMEGYECLYINLEKRLLNPHLIANLSYSILYSTDNLFKIRGTEILFEIYQRVCFKGEKLLPEPYPNIPNTNVNFWAIDENNIPPWFYQIYSGIDYRQLFGITNAMLEEYGQNLFNETINVTLPGRPSLRKIIRKLEPFAQFINNTRSALIPRPDCKRILVTVNYKNLPYGSVILYYKPSDPQKIRMQWIFRFPIYQILDQINPGRNMLAKIPRINSILIPAIIEMLGSNSSVLPYLHEVNTIYVDPIGLQSDYLQNYYLFVWDLEKVNYYPCDTLDSGPIASKLKFRFRD